MLGRASAAVIAALALVLTPACTGVTTIGPTAAQVAPIAEDSAEAADSVEAEPADLVETNPSNPSNPSGQPDLESQGADGPSANAGVPTHATSTETGNRETGNRETDDRAAVANDSENDIASGTGDGASLTDDLADGEVAGDDGPVPQAAAFVDDLPDGWVAHDAGVFKIGLPNDWAIITRKTEVEPAFEAVQANGAPLRRREEVAVTSMLSAGDSVYALDQDGSNITAFREFGPSTTLIHHDKLADRLTTEFRTHADNVAFESEARLVDHIAGVIIRGRYDAEATTVYMYQFITHEGAYLYYFTVTLVGQDNPALATDLFRSITIAGPSE